jgi:phosphate transport system protein
MREAFQAHLKEVDDLLVTMAEEARAAMRAATDAVLAPDKEEAEGVVRGDDRIDDGFRRVEEQVYSLLAQQAPVASDLRRLLTARHIASELERMGDLAEHIAKAALRRYPERAVADELAPVIRDMGRIADALAAKMAEVLGSNDADRAAGMEQDDDAMDELHRQLFALMLGTAWRHGVESAIDGALLGRFYERYADHAVNVGRQVVYLVTGATPAI